VIRNGYRHGAGAREIRRSTRPVAGDLNLVDGGPSVDDIPNVTTGVSLRYGHVESLVAAFLRVHQHREGALVARFRLLRRNAFPRGVNVGSSGRFAYDFDATMATMVAFAMMDAFVLPQMATELILARWDVIGPAVGRTAGSMWISHGRIAADRSRPNAGYIVIETHGRRQWSAPVSDGGDGRGQAYRPTDAGVLSVMTEDEMIAAVRRPLSDEPRPGIIVIDLHGVTAWTISAIVQAGWATLPEIFPR